MNNMILVVILTLYIGIIQGYQKYSSFLSRNIRVNHIYKNINLFSNPTHNDRKEIGKSFMEQKNHILLDRFYNPKNGNLTETAITYVNLCDESFDVFLTNQMTEAYSEPERQRLGRIRYEVNMARRYKLVEADKILRSILSAGGLKQMEAKLAYYLTRSEIDMAFMVILQLNIEDAIHANVTTAVQVMKHLETLITEYQDDVVNPPVRLLRMLLRADDINIRKQMLRQKLLYTTPEGEVLSSGEIEKRARGSLNTQNAVDAITNPTITTTTSSSSSSSTTITSETDGILPTPSSQCENILVKAVKSWGDADVKFEELDDTISDVLAQILSTGVQKLSRADLERKCGYLREEIAEVKQEFQLFLSRSQNNKNQGTSDPEKCVLT